LNGNIKKLNFKKGVEKMKKNILEFIGAFLLGVLIFNIIF